MQHTRRLHVPTLIMAVALLTGSAAHARRPTTGHAAADAGVPRDGAAGKTRHAGDAGAPRGKAKAAAYSAQAQGTKLIISHHGKVTRTINLRDPIKQITPNPRHPLAVVEIVDQDRLPQASYLVDLRRGRRRQLPMTEGGFFPDLSWSPDGEHAVLSTNSGHLVVWASRQLPRWIEGRRIPEHRVAGIKQKGDPFQFHSLHDWRGPGRFTFGAACCGTSTIYEYVIPTCRLYRAAACGAADVRTERDRRCWRDARRRIEKGTATPMRAPRRCPTL